MRTMRSINKLYSIATVNVNNHLLNTTLHVRQSTTVVCENYKKNVPLLLNVRQLGLGPTSKDFEEPPQITGPLTKAHATELVLHLNDEERKMLFAALQEYESNRIKEEFEDKLAGQRWRSKLGRPSKVPTLGDVDPTGSYCPVPEDWLKKKYAATVPKPTTKELFHLSLANSVPFIGFGFLDNFIMIRYVCPRAPPKRECARAAAALETEASPPHPAVVLGQCSASDARARTMIIAGDRIESSMSAYITLSTMAAAALGNTFSDVVGIGSSYYVERGAALLGLAAPPLSPVQLDMPASRRAANMGRVLGITLGCFLGMTPLLFKDDEKKDAKES